MEKDVTYAVILLDSFEKETGIAGTQSLVESGIEYRAKGETIQPNYMWGDKKAFPVAPYDSYVFYFNNRASFNHFVNWMGNRKVRNFNRILNRIVVVSASSVEAFVPKREREKHRGVANAKKYGII